MTTLTSRQFFFKTVAGCRAAIRTVSPPSGIFPVNAYLPFFRSAFFIANSRWSGNDSRSPGSASAVPSSRPLQWRNITADKTSPANSARMSVNVCARTTARVLLLNPGAVAGRTTDAINERSAHREQLPVLIARFALNATTFVSLCDSEHGSPV